MKSKIKRIGVLTGGGDCPGLNAVIRAVTKTAINDYDVEVVGFKDGFQGLVENTYVNLTSSYVSGILTMGGTILGTNNQIDPFHYPMLEGDKTLVLDRSDEAIRNVKRLGLDVVVCIGGDGTMAVSKKMEEKGLKAIGVPKTIDNDLFGTDVTFGFDSAMTTATEAIDKLHSTAQSHHRVMIVEVMGRYAGWLALCSGMAGGGDIILIPEIPFSIDSIVDTIKERRYDGKYFSILIVGEGAKPLGGEMVVQRRVDDSAEAVRLGGIGNKVGEMIENASGVETRVTILGHLVRGGVPSPNDRLLATRFGVEAMRLVANGEFGKMVALQGDKIASIPIEEVGGKCRTVPLDSPIIAAARSVGTCLGD